MILYITPSSNARSLRSLAPVLPIDSLSESPHLKCKDLIGRGSKAYWYFKNRNRLEGEKGSAKKLLKDNRALAKLLRDYFSADNYLYALKGGETLSVQSLIEDLKQYERPDKLELIAKLESNRPLWRALERLVGDE